MRIPARMQPVWLFLGLSLIAGSWLWTRIDRSKPTQQELEQFLAAHLQTVLPAEPAEKLTPRQERATTEIIGQLTRISTTAELDYQRLNFVFGYMGAEQHLPRYPGDRLTWKDEFARAGMTREPGAFGYFAASKKQLDEEAFLREKYYVAVQTLYLSTWNQEWLWLKNWYRFRKMLVVNPENGKAVVAAVGDAGPARYTGKQFGGSPEVMAYLGLDQGKQKGLVLALFVDEEKGKFVPLGPVKYGRFN